MEAQKPFKGDDESTQAAESGGEYYDEVQNIISNKLSIDKSEIGRDSDIMEDLGADSLDVQDLILSIEDKWDLEFPVEQADEFRTVGDVVEALQELEKSRSA